jgi:hypothetical protein
MTEIISVSGLSRDVAELRAFAKEAEETLANLRERVAALEVKADT